MLELTNKVYVAYIVPNGYGTYQSVTSRRVSHGSSG
jgi:hypothetical protein